MCLTLYDLNYSYTPVPMKDGAVCSSCTVLSYVSNDFKFNVTSFSTYSASSNSKLSVSVVDDNSKIIPDETVYFYANYTNRTSGINISGINCNISFNGSYINMSFNSSSGRYYYNRTFEDQRVRTYTQNYNVSCFGSALGYEDLNTSSVLLLN